MPITLDHRQFIAASNRSASRYDQHAKWQQEIAKRLLEHLDFMRFTPKTILDVGVRTGYSMQLLRKRFPKALVIGLDEAEKMLHQARRNSHWWRRLNLVCAHDAYLPIANQSMDLVVANGLLDELQTRQQTLQEIQRVLRPEGLFIFSAWGVDTLRELRASWAQVDNYVHVHDFTDMHDWGDALLQMGLCEPVVDSEQLTWLYDDVYQLFRDLKNTACHNLATTRRNYLTGKHRFQQFLAAYENYRQPDGAWPVTLEIVYGQTWKAALAATAKADEHGEIRIPLQAIKVLTKQVEK